MTTSTQTNTTSQTTIGTNESFINTATVTVGTIVGVSIAVLLLLLFVIAIILKRRRSQEHEPALDDDTNPVYGTYMAADPVVEVEDANMYYADMDQPGVSRSRDNNSRYEFST